VVSLKFAIIVLYFDVDIQAKLEKMQSNLQQCWKSLLALLDRRQQKFPRFYFLSTEDVLHVVCSGTFNLLV
jgi:dynein heavy chain